jgi:hypothetical protein
MRKGRLPFPVLEKPGLGEMPFSDVGRLRLGDVPISDLEVCCFSSFPTVRDCHYSRHFTHLG